MGVCLITERVVIITKFDDKNDAIGINMKQLIYWHNCLKNEFNDRETSLDTIPTDALTLLPSTRLGSSDTGSFITRQQTFTSKDSTKNTLYSKLWVVLISCPFTKQNPFIARRTGTIYSGYVPKIPSLISS